MAELVHVVSKQNNAEHAVCPLSTGAPASPLAASTVRVRPSLISLTANNLSYARLGAVLHWWDAYPVPDSLPAPFNNAEDWGIVPAWGYGTVVESSIDGIAAGSLLWGFWPTSSHVVSLQLEPGEPRGFWRETSPHRSNLMTLYNQYEEAATESSHTMAMKALFKPLWGAAYLLNHAVFSKSRPFHPLGLGGAWTAEDADLSSAVVISLSASSKTGRSFAWQLARDRDVAVAGPRGLVQLTSNPDTLVKFSDTSLPIKTARYGEPGVAEWVAEFKPSRIVLIDSGAPDEALDALLSAISGISASTTIIAVGSEPKVYQAEELQSYVARSQSLGKVQLNTSTLRDRVLEVEKPAEFFPKCDDAWAECYSKGGFGSVEVTSLQGVGGTRGIEGAWEDLCKRKVPLQVGMVVHPALLGGASSDAMA